MNQLSHTQHQTNTVCVLGYAEARVSFSAHPPRFAQLLRSMRLPIRPAENRLVFSSFSSGQRLHQTFRQSESGHFQFSTSTTRQYSSRTSNTPSRSSQRDQVQLSWLDADKGSEFQVLGTVTEIEVPKAGIFPLYAIFSGHERPKY